MLLTTTACFGSVDVTQDLDPDGSDVSTPFEDTRPDMVPIDDIGQDLKPIDANCSDCGEQLLAQFCGTCHGVDGTGAALFPGDISGFVNIAPIVRDGTGDMAAIPTVTENQIAQIQQFLSERANPNESAWSADEAFARKCAGCHGAEGEGFSRGYWLQQPIDGYFEFITRNGIDRPEYDRVMPGYDDLALTSEQLSGIVQKLRAYPIDRSGQGLWDTYCANCHGVDSAGGAVPIDIRGVSDVEFLNNTRSGHRGMMFENPGYMPGYSDLILTSVEVDAMFLHYQSL